MFQKRKDSASSNCNSKGQVTIFIILGMILLLIIILIILLKTEVLQIPGELAPTQKGKVEQFIINCIQQSGEEALNQAGLQGGYVTVPAEAASDGALHLRLSPMNVVPYWVVGTSKNIPPLEQIKSQADAYIEKNVHQCLLDSKAFQETYDLKERSTIKSDTRFVDSKTIFNVHWDLEIKNKGGEVIAEVIDHAAESPVKFKRLYDTARLIVEKELETLKLEDLTQDLIALEHPNVPIAGVDLSCERKEWDVSEVKQTIQELLRINLKQLKLQGTNFEPFPEDLTYYQNHYLWNVGEDFSQPQVGVTFNYDPGYPFIFGVTPLQGGKMRSSSLGGTSVLSSLCVQSWKFTYDVSYPVLVQISDETTGYVLNSAFTVHLVRNVPDRSASVGASRPSYVLPTITDEDFCNRRAIPMTVLTQELVENKHTGIYNREPLDEVNISFTCLRYSCDLGATEYNFRNRGDVAGFTQYFPYCAGAILRAEKPSYKEDWTRLATTENKEVELNLIPLHLFPASKISFVKHEVDSQEIGSAQELDPEEIVSLRVRYFQPNETTPFQDSGVAFSSRLGEQLLQTQSLTLLAKTDFTYDLDITLINNEQLVGGYQGNWTVPWEELAEAQKITFHLLYKKPRTEQEAYTFMLSLPEQSLLIPLPEIK